MRIVNHKNDGVYLEFDNGFKVSTIWGSGSYSENYNIDYKLPIDEQFAKHEDGSGTVEVYFTDIPKGGERLHKSLLKKYNDEYEQPIGNLKVKDWMDLIQKVNRWKPLTKEREV